MKYLGIDYGKKRIGLSTSDDSNTLAFPLKTVLNTKNVVDDILEIIKKENITLVVLGESKDSNMKNNPIMKEILLFKEKLQTHDIVVEFHPEFYSSAQVISIMGEENKSIDASAAAIILQNYLDLQKNK